MNLSALSLHGNLKQSVYEWFGLSRVVLDYAFKYVVFGLAEVWINVCSDYQGCTVPNLILRKIQDIKIS